MWSGRLSVSHRWGWDFSLTRLPLPESTAIGYAAPLLIVVFSALLLKERVHLFRWSAVLIGMVGVLIILWPRLTLFSSGTPIGNAETVGAISALGAAVFSAFAMMQVRKLVQTERTETIVLYFFICASLLSLLTIGGALIIVASGIAVIWREHYLGLDRGKARAATTP